MYVNMQECGPCFTLKADQSAAWNIWYWRHGIWVGSKCSQPTNQFRLLLS